MDLKKMDGRELAELGLAVAQEQARRILPAEPVADPSAPFMQRVAAHGGHALTRAFERNQKHVAIALALVSCFIGYGLLRGYEVIARLVAP